MNVLEFIEVLKAKRDTCGYSQSRPEKELYTCGLLENHRQAYEIDRKTMEIQLIVSKSN